MNTRITVRIWLGVDDIPVETGGDIADVLAHIEPVNDGLLSGILADHILMEKSKGALVQCGGQTNDERIKILQRLAPDILDGAVAFVHDDAAKKFRRIFLVVDYFLRRFAAGGNIRTERSFHCRLIQVLSLQNEVHPLDGADVGLRIGGHSEGLQAVNGSNSGKYFILLRTVSGVLNSARKVYGR